MCLHPVLSMRAVKEMLAMKQLGHRITLVYENIGLSVQQGYDNFWDKEIKLPSNNYFGEYYARRLCPVSYKNQLKKIFDNENFDLIHAYSMPDTLALAAIRYFDVPVVYDSRDISSGMDQWLLEDLKISHLNKFQSYFYNKIVKKFEREANERSSARICVSDEMKQFICNVYNVSQENTIVLPNYQSSLFLPSKLLPKKSNHNGSKHIVYIGNILFDDFERVIQLLNGIATKSIHIHLYPTGTNSVINEIKNHLEPNEHIHFHKPLPIKELLEKLQQYDYGLVPRPPDRNSINNGFALPNKLFDYLAAGLPVLARNTESISRFIKKNKIGVIFEDVKDLVSNIMGNPNSFTFDRDKFVIENHIHLLDNLYKKLCVNKK